MTGILAACQGWLGRDPESSRLNGRQFLSFPLRVHDPRDSAPTWIRVEVWDALAEEHAPRLAKDTEVYVEGRLTLVTYTGKDGAGHQRLDLTATVCQAIGQIGPKGAHP